MPSHLRPEARPTDWDQLDTTQQAGFRAVLKMIEDAVAGVSETSTPLESIRDPALWFSANRSSRTAFLSGGRGTGKTTLLASIIISTLKESNWVTNKPDLDKRIVAARSRVIWLEPIDMEPMPPSANLLAAILVRVEDSVRRFGSAGTTSGGASESERYEPRGLMDAGPAYHDALLDLQRLQTDSALAWQSNLPAREGQLDPDSYAVEVMRGEHARLSINRKLQEVLDRLADIGFRGTGIHSPLFVLPIDDVDLNPLACLDLLKLLRMISVPRLFTLLLGDIRVADLVLNLKLSSDLGRVFSGVRHAELLALQPVFVGAMAGDIAANALRKLLPPSQRVQLDPMSLTEGLNFRPLGHLPADPHLHQLLAECPMRLEDNRVPFAPAGASNAPQPVFFSFRDFMLTRGLALRQTSPPPAFPAGPIKKELPEKTPYSGANVFCSTPRRMADLWLTLRNTAEMTPKPGQSEDALADVDENWLRETAAAEVVKHFALLSKTSLAGDAALSPQERAVITKKIVQQPEGGWRLDRLMIRAVPGFEERFAIDFPLAGRRHRCRISVAIAKGWDFELEDSSERVTPPPQEGCPPPPARQLDFLAAAELTVFHDLLALGPGTGNLGSGLLSLPALVGSGLATAEWRFETEQSATLPWPAPPVQSFWENDLFHDAWQRLLPTVTSAAAGTQLRSLFYAWLSAGTAVIDRKLPELLPVTDENLPWSKIVQRLVDLGKLAGGPSSPQATAARDWLVRVALLLMPESGLPQQIVNGFVKPASSLRPCWQQWQGHIVRNRAVRLAELARNEMHDLVNICCGTVVLGGVKSQFAPSLRLIYKLAGIQHPDAPSGKAPRNKRPGSTLKRRAPTRRPGTGPAPAA